MSSPAFGAPLTLAVEPSRGLRAALVLLYALAGVSLLVLPVPWLVGGGALLAASLAHEWRRARRRPRLCWRADGTWELPDSSRPAALHGSTFVSRWFVVLALQDGARVHRWLLVRDALPPVAWRRLRARLRVAGAALAGREAGGPPAG